MKSLFISDLHLDPQRTDIQSCFDQFIHSCLATKDTIDALYILGDLFEVWLGDDASIPMYKQAISQLKQLSQAGIKVYFMHGNRDFLIGSDFAQASGCTLLPDPYQIELVIDNKKQKILLSHGDIFCTDDKNYMSFRKMVRDPLWQKEFLSQSIAERVNIARAMRQQSKKSQSTEKDLEISDVNQTVIEQLMLEQQCKLLIHGHTHRPAVHNFTLHDSLHKRAARRIVLPDWKPGAEVLEIGSDNKI